MTEIAHHLCVVLFTSVELAQHVLIESVVLALLVVGRLGDLFFAFLDPRFQSPFGIFVFVKVNEGLLSQDRKQVIFDSQLVGQDGYFLLEHVLFRLDLELIEMVLSVRGEILAPIDNARVLIWEVTEAFKRLDAVCVDCVSKLFSIDGSQLELQFTGICQVKFHVDRASLHLVAEKGDEALQPGNESVRLGHFKRNVNLLQHLCVYGLSVFVEGLPAVTTGVSLDLSLDFLSSGIFVVYFSGLSLKFVVNRVELCLNLVEFALTLPKTQLIRETMVTYLTFALTHATLSIHTVDFLEVGSLCMCLAIQLCLSSFDLFHHFFFELGLTPCIEVGLRIG